MAQTSAKSEPRVKQRKNTAAKMAGVTVAITGVDRRADLAKKGIQVIQNLSRIMDVDEFSTVIEALERVHPKATSGALTPERAAGAKAEMVQRAFQGRAYTDEQVRRLEDTNRERALKARREILAGALTASEVAARLGSKTRQTAHDRMNAGKLLGIEDNHRWLFPIWQFDADGPNGVVQGLPEVLRELGSYASVTSMQKAKFLTYPNPFLSGRTPLEALKEGDIEKVVGVARAVGVS